jgi:hypothetical protein
MQWMPIFRDIYLSFKIVTFKKNKDRLSHRLPIRDGTGITCAELEAEAPGR